MADIPKWPIKMSMLEEISFDGGSWGVGFHIDTQTSSISTSERKEIKYLLNGVAKKMKSVRVRLFEVDPKVNLYSSSLSKNGGLRLLAIFYINDLNGNLLLRSHIQTKYAIDMSRCRSTDHSKKSRENFIPVKTRVLGCWHKIRKDFKNVPAESVMLKLEELKDGFKPELA